MEKTPVVIYMTNPFGKSVQFDIFKQLLGRGQRISIHGTDWDGTQADLVVVNEVAEMSASGWSTLTMTRTVPKVRKKAAYKNTHFDAINQGRAARKLVSK